MTVNRVILHIQSIYYSIGLLWGIFIGIFRLLCLIAYMHG